MRWKKVKKENILRKERVKNEIENNLFSHGAPFMNKENE